MKDVSQAVTILRRVRELLEASDWCPYGGADNGKGLIVSPTSPGAVRFDLTGAVEAVSSVGWPDDDFCAAYDCLRNLAGMPLAEWCSNRLEKHEAIRLVQAAIDFLERSGQQATRKETLP